ncbi:uncharacterized protein LOC115408984 [Salarias fasciatus]|uniref:uncharacterized protein LOC115408984 n=1 Tax=Salarias fasciatus TaxID=181472 RepID=UPI001176C0E9|nr:uncharacterized protein LOC115408984 [Salarias fasciatus]
MRNRENRALSKFETAFSDRSRPIFLYLAENHFSGIKNLKGFLGVRYVCSFCFQGYNNPHTHSCGGYCPVCNDPDCKQRVWSPVTCDRCNRTCRSSECFDKHNELRERIRGETYASNCDIYKKCLKCNSTYKKRLTGENREHVCIKRRCKTCGESLADESETAGNQDRHLCYMQPLNVDEKHSEKLIFYDFETFVDQTGVHRPYLVCTKTLSGVDCVEKFIAHFRKPRYKDSIFIAHNSKGFDSYLIVNTMVKLGIEPSLIMMGGKILKLSESDYNLKFIDSLSFLSMRLSDMPKAMGFEDQSKGFFPHKFSSAGSLKYTGPYPPPTDYGFERMSCPEQVKFQGWYDSVSRGVFDFEKEALFYCKNDVQILFEGCVRFRNQFLNETKVDPFSRITISSACMKVFLTNFLRPRTLAIPPPDDYRRQVKSYSHASIQWLEYVSHSRGVFIQHALNRGETQIGPYFVDGFATIDDVEWVFEFQGCFFHGCPICFQPHETCPLTGKPFEELYTASEEKLHRLRSVYGLQTCVIWEHEWLEMKKSDPRVGEFLKEFDPPEPLSPRQALYGGRTSALRLWYTAGAGESVHYVDVTSLYPYVNSSCAYPLGHPTVIHKDFDDPQNYFGLIRAVVNPPQGLSHPVLPYKSSRGKLLFTLCRTCAEINNQMTLCNHDENACALTGVWVTPEFNKALELGYKVAKIIEVWHFSKRSDSVFVGYVHTFLKGKQEASGYPADAVDQESRDRYIQQYKLEQGIQLDADRIRFNPALRSVCKLALTCFWGKMAERPNLKQTSIVSDPAQFFSYLFSGKYQIKYFSFLNNDAALVQWNYNERCVVPPGRTYNVFVAAFTTAYGRLKLYSYLERLQEKVLYTDTDSIVYLLKDGDTPLELGNYLGDLTDELSGDTISEFVAAGPKTYAYQTKNAKKVVMRVKGITQTRDFSDKVSFDSARELVEGYLRIQRSDSIDIPQQNIIRDKRGFLLKNSSFTKKLRIVYDKRKLSHDGTSVPFGY